MAQQRTTRRTWLRRAAQGGLAAGGGLAWALEAGRLFAAPAPRPKVAAIFTEFRFRSHAFNILENFFEPYFFSGQLVDPGCEVVAFYADQFPQDDMARDVAKRFGVPLYPTIEAAVARGGDRLAVDAVLSIAEHGDFPYNPLGQHLYPRKQFFDRAVSVMKQSGKFVPFFNDKHLSYRWDYAKEMVDTARQHGFPIQAGSSVPLAERRPAFDLPAGAVVEEALSIHSGGLEVYDFHAMEVLQSIIEGRRGGETGIARVEFLEATAAERAADAGRWSRDLLQAAMQAEHAMKAQRETRPDLAANFRRQNVVPLPNKPNIEPRLSHVILLTYRDGTQGTIVHLTPSDSNRWNFACRLKGENTPRATAYFNGPWGNRCLFKALSHAIQGLFKERREPYPIERTLLVTGALEAAMQSHQLSGAAVETPHLDVAYQPVEWARFRETGATWRRITIDTPQPATFEPGDAKLKLAEA